MKRRKMDNESATAIMNQIEITLIRMGNDKIYKGKNLHLIETVITDQEQCIQCPVVITLKDWKLYIRADLPFRVQKEAITYAYIIIGEINSKEADQSLAHFMLDRLSGDISVICSYPLDQNDRDNADGLLNSERFKQYWNEVKRLAFFYHNSLGHVACMDLETKNSSLYMKFIEVTVNASQNSPDESIVQYGTAALEEHLETPNNVIGLDKIDCPKWLLGQDDDFDFEFLELDE